MAFRGAGAAEQTGVGSKQEGQTAEVLIKYIIKSSGMGPLENR